MKHLILISFFLALTLSSIGQTLTSKPKTNPEVLKMVKEISPDSIHGYIKSLVAFGTRHSLSDTTSNTIGIGAARRWVRSKFKSFSQNLEVKFQPFTLTPGPDKPRIVRTTVMKNVVATLKGTDPDDDRILIIAGHLDSRNSNAMDSIGLAPGANDDASGVSVVLETARVLSKRKFPCTIIFLVTQGEEQGLMGAEFMAHELKLQKKNVIAMLNNDIVGNVMAGETGEKNEKTIRIFSEMIPSSESDAEAKVRRAMYSENDSPSRQLARYVKEVSEPYLNGFTATLNMRRDRFMRGGDHTPFCKEGFAAIRFTEFHENFTQQHQTIRTEKNIRYGDLLEFVNPRYTANVAKMNLVALVSLAIAPAAPLEVKMSNSGLGNSTTLKWKAPPTSIKVSGYNILVRETYQPFWEKKFFVKELNVTLPMSKDNYFFAVQAVGMNGELSPIIFPGIE